jgi:predicted ATPase/DNA-binding SARP family transcriptional activator/predicted negative regulator of RcsB-dependent stress response
LDHLALISYLAVSGQAQNRSSIINLLWTDYDQSHASGALRTTLWKINQTGMKSWLDINRKSISLRKDKDLRVDTDIFQQLFEMCKLHGHHISQVCQACIPLLSEAIELYGGEFLSGFSLKDAPNFDDWQRLQNEYFQIEITSVLEKLVVCFFNQKRYNQAIRYTRRWLEFDPVNEEPHRLLMRIYTNLGQRGAAIQQYQACCDVLEKEFGIKPNVVTTKLFHKIVNGEDEETSTSRKYHTSLNYAVSPHNLPTQLTPFIGRENELLRIKKLFSKSECRLLTLVGAGGMGKTRLALQAATELIHQYRDGVFFIPLTSLWSFDLILPAIAEALHSNLHSKEDPLTQIINILREKNILLILDNFEHILHGVEVINELISHTSELDILITSRERLNLRSEWIFEVNGMSYPKNGYDDIEQYSSIQLFMQSAIRVYPDYILDDIDKPHLGRICHLVEGMPLAIELASSWVRTLTCKEIADELEFSLDILETKMRDYPDRHRSLNAVFNHSWDLLSEEERRVLRRLSVFKSGFDRVAAEKIANASLLSLATCVDKSLLHHTPDGRYGMLSTMRKFLETKLNEQSKEEEKIKNRFCEYYTSFISEQTYHLMSSKQLQALDDISNELENIRAAWEWALNHHRWDAIDRSIGALSIYFDTRGRFKEAVTIFGKATQLLQSVSSSNYEITIGMLLTAHGWFLFQLGYYNKGLKNMSQGLEIFRRHESNIRTAFALWFLAEANLRLENYTKASKQVNECISILDDISEPDSRISRPFLAHATYTQGIIEVNRGNYPIARQIISKSLSIFKDIQNPRGTALSLNALGKALVELGEYDEAMSMREESLQIFTDIGDRRGMAMVLNNLSNIHDILGEYEKAIKLLKRTVDISNEIGDRRFSAIALINLASIFSNKMDNQQEAQNLYFESNLIFNDLHDQRGSIHVLCGMGESLLKSGEEQKSMDYYQDALQIATRMNSIPLTLQVLTGISSVVAKRGDFNQAIEIWTMVLSNPETDIPTENRARELLAQHKHYLLKQDAEFSQKRGRRLDINDVINIYLEV